MKNLEQVSLEKRAQTRRAKAQCLENVISTIVTFNHHHDHPLYRSNHHHHQHHGHHHQHYHCGRGGENM